MRGRKPTPTEVHRVRGTLRKKRHAHRAAEPEAPGHLCGPPEHLTEAQRAVWVHAAANAEQCAEADRPRRARGVLHRRRSAPAGGNRAGRSRPGLVAAPARPLAGWGADRVALCACHGAGDGRHHPHRERARIYASCPDKARRTGRGGGASRRLAVGKTAAPARRQTRRRSAGLSLTSQQRAARPGPHRAHPRPAGAGGCGMVRRLP